MRTRTGRRLAGILLGTGAMLLPLAAPATAAPNTGSPTADISVGRLVLEPTGRGYHGSLPVTVTNNGPDATYFSVHVVEPVAGSLGRLDPEEACGFGAPKDNRRTATCSVPGGDIEPGESRSFSITFDVLTPTRDVAMIAKGGRISVNVGDGRDEVADRASFAARFRSTSGSLRHPVPYVQDTQARADITTAGSVTLTRQADGSYQGRLPVTVGWAGDTAHEYLFAEATGLPAGVVIWGTDPQDAPSSFTNFVVPGDRFMTGEKRSFDVLLRAGPETVPGDLGNVSLQLSTQWYGNSVADADPTDNTASFTVRVTDAA